MCTAIFDDLLFGRTLDLECSYGESIVITPRGYKFNYLYENNAGNNAIIGIAHVDNGVPLYYDAINEKGLCIAGLNFPKYAVYGTRIEGKVNIASFELIPYVLRRCNNVKEVTELFLNISITNDSFSDKLKSTPLHWIIADENESITVEATKDFLKIYKNTLGVLTNSPDFAYHKANLSNYMGLNSKTNINSLCKTELEIYSRGLGAFGLPGDFSSSSRFVRGVFVKNHTVKDNDRIGRFFHIMDSVSVPKGCIITDTLEPVYTVYTSCMDIKKCIYYYTTYDNRKIKAVSLFDFNLDKSELYLTAL